MLATLTLRNCTLAARESFDATLQISRMEPKVVAAFVLIAAISAAAVFAYNRRGIERYATSPTMEAALADVRANPTLERLPSTAVPRWGRMLL